MSSKRRKLVNGALLGAAATALSVKTALAGPLGAAAQAPLDDAKQKLVSLKDAAVKQAESSLQKGLIRVPTTSQANGNRGPATTAVGPKTAPVKQSAQGVAAIELEYPKHMNSPAAIRKILHDAAIRHGLDPKLVLAISFWESGWDQSRVSSAGAVGVMQVEPDTAAEAGPALLGRTVDLNDVYDNADVGAAIFRQYLDAFGTPAGALAAYNQGPTSLRANGMLPDTQNYVQGILDLAARMSPDGTISS
jgi:soluble lytic murein transglycosylase-like protein